MSHPISTYSGKIRFDTILNHPNVQKRELILEKHKPSIYEHTEGGYGFMRSYETTKIYSHKVTNGYYSILTSN